MTTSPIQLTILKALAVKIAGRHLRDGCCHFNYKLRNDNGKDNAHWLYTYNRDAFCLYIETYNRLFNNAQQESN